MIPPVPFVARKEPTRPRAYTPLINDRFNESVLGVPGIPDPIRESQTPGTRPAMMQIALFGRWFAWQVDAFLLKHVFDSPNASMPTGRLTPLGHRFNIRRTPAGGFGSMFEFGGENEEEE